MCTSPTEGALDDSHSDTGVAGMEAMIASAAEHQPLSSLGLFVFYVLWFSVENVSRGERMEEVNDPEK